MGNIGKWITAVGLALTLSACATGTMLTSRGVENIAKNTGMYRLILFGANYTSDLEAVGVLDIEGDGYEFEPDAAPFNYTVEDHQAGYEAFEKAEKFVTAHRSARGYASREILAPDGAVIGYEIRPLYRLIELDINDPVNVNYELMPDGKVKFYVWLDERVERHLLPQTR